MAKSMLFANGVITIYGSNYSYNLTNPYSQYIYVDRSDMYELLHFGPKDIFKKIYKYMHRDFLLVYYNMLHSPIMKLDPIMICTLCESFDNETYNRFINAYSYFSHSIWYDIPIYLRPG